MSEAKLSSLAGSVRSTRAEVRNPLLALPAARELMNHPARMELRALLIDLGAECQRKADECWKKHKAPMAAYWKACAVYARHIARLIGRNTKGTSHASR